MSNFQNIHFSPGLRDDDLLCAGKSEANYPRLLGSHQVSLIQETVNLQKRRLSNNTASTIGRQIKVPISVTVDSADDFSEYTDNTFKSIDGFVPQSIPTQKILIHNRDKNNQRHGMSKLFHPLNSYTKTPEQISEKNNGQLSYKQPCTDTFTYHYLDDLNNTFLNLNFPDKAKNFITSHPLSDNNASILDKKYIHNSLDLSSNTRISKECNTQYMEIQDDFEDELFSYHGLTNTTTTTTTTSVNATAYTDQETNSIDCFIYSSPHVSKTSSQSSYVNPHTIKDISILCTEKSKSTSTKKTMIKTLNQLQDTDFLLHSFNMDMDMDMDMDTNMIEPVCSGRVHPSDKMFEIRQDLSHHHLCNIRRIQDKIPQDHIQYNHTKSTTSRDVLDVNKDIIPSYMYSNDNMTSFMPEKYNNIDMNQNARAPIYYSMTSHNLSKWNEVVQMNNNKQQDDYKQEISKSLNALSSISLVNSAHTRSHFCPIYQPFLPILTDKNDVNTNPNSNISTNSNTPNHTCFHHAMAKTIHDWPYSTYLAEGFDMK